MIPNGEKVIADYLREHDDVAAIVGRRVVSKTPENTDSPWVRYTQIDAPSTGSPHHLIEFYFQFDCYAGKDGGQPEASLLARTVCTALAEIDGEDYQADGAVVKGVRPNAGLRNPDSDPFTPARERFVSTALVWMHAAEEGS